MHKKTLILGASLKVDRYSNLAIRRLIAKNYEVVAIGNTEGNVAGVAIVNGMPEFKDIDTVTLYLRPERQKAYYNYIISLDPKRVIFNPGTENMEFVEVLKNNNIEVDIACTLVLISTNQY